MVTSSSSPLQFPFWRHLSARCCKLGVARLPAPISRPVTAVSSAHFSSRSRFDHDGGSSSSNPTIWASMVGGLAGGILLSKRDEEQRADSANPSQTFPLLAHCAQSHLRVPLKERQSAINALNIVADVAEESQPAVVSICSTEKGFLARQTQSTGSGFIIDDAGHVITNAHVVGYRTNVFVHLSDGRSFPSRVIAVDVVSDLAILKLDVKQETARSLPQIPLAPDLKAVRPGHFVLALGSPLMLANSVTVGVVSALDRDLGHSGGLKYIQTDAIITFGNSGGPLVNLYGQVIGVNSMVAGTGVGFAIPIDQVRKFVQLAKQAAAQKDETRTRPTTPNTTPASDSYIITESGARPNEDPQRRYLGLVMRTLTPELAFELSSRAGPEFADVIEGVLLQAVMRNSPAQRAGLKAGDVIVAIDGLPITTAQQVSAAVESRDTLSITVLRRGKRITFSNIKAEQV